MKKILALLLAGVMIFSVIGCSKEDEDVKGKIKGNNKQEEEMEDKEVSVMDTLGNTEEAVYENEYLGIGFTLPSNWVFYTDEQINEMNGIVQDAVDEDMAQIMEDEQLIYDMIAQETTGNNVNVVIEKAKTSAIEKMDEKAYFEQSRDTATEGLEQMGFSIIETEIASMNFVGEKHATLSVVCSMNGITLYEKMVCMKVGSYFACVTATAINDDVTDDILSNFYSLK